MTHKPAVLVVGEGFNEASEICATLSVAGYQVCYVSSFEAGVTCLGERLVEFVIVSQGTRSFEGRSVLMRAIAKDRHLPVLVVTRSVDTNIYMESMHLGALDYLENPGRAGLLEMVEAIELCRLGPPDGYKW